MAGVIPTETCPLQRPGADSRREVLAASPQLLLPAPSTQPADPPGGGGGRTCSLRACGGPDPTATSALGTTHIALESLMRSPLLSDSLGSRKPGHGPSTGLTDI